MAAHLFLSYSHRDENLRDELAKHLKLLERQGILRPWHDRQIGAGEEWRNTIDEHLQSADIILLLISADFLASDYCYDVEAKAALEKHERGDATVIPVILRPVDWRSSPFGKLQALPKDAKPVTTYDNLDVAFEEIASGIRALTSRLGAKLDDKPRPETELALLPVSPSTPLLVALAIDVSGSMQSAIQTRGGLDSNRLQAVMDSLKHISGASATQGDAAGWDTILASVKTFAYGFGFTDRVADFAPLASLASRFLNVSLPSAPSRVFKGPVRDLIEIGGLGDKAVRLDEIGRQWDQIESRLWEQRFDLFGDTPMQRGMQIVKDRLQREFRGFPGIPRSALIIVSDGESTDGSPIAACRSIQGLGTTVVGAYLTSSDIAEPKRLYADPIENWPQWAKTLFEMTSAVGEDGAALGLLNAKGWDATFRSRLFVQINQSQIMAEFIESVVEIEAQARAHGTA